MIHKEEVRDMQLEDFQRGLERVFGHPNYVGEFRNELRQSIEWLRVVLANSQTRPGDRSPERE